MESSDIELIEQFRQTGTQKFLDELLNRHLTKVRSMVFQMLLDHNAADDVTQEIFLRVVRGLDRFEGRSEFSTWLFQIAMNTSRTFLKSRGRNQSRVTELRDDFAVTGNAPDGNLLQAELGTEVEEALLQLTPQLRGAIVLVSLQGQTAADAAKIEGCTTDTMYWRVHEARRQLKQILADHMS